MAKIRVTQQRLIVGVENLDKIRVTQQKVDVALTAGTARLTQQRVLVGVEGGGLRLTQQRLLILDSPNTLIQSRGNVLTFGQSVDDGFTSNTQKPGSLLQLTQTLSREITLNVATTLNLSFNTGATKGQTTNRSVQNSLNIEQNAIRQKVIPTQNTSSFLYLNSYSIGGFRLAENTVLLTHLATAEITQIFESALSNLVFSQNVSLSGSVKNTTASNILVFTSTVNFNTVTNKSTSNQLVFNQLAFGVPIKGKKYVLLQAPFDCVQTSVVLPAPLVGDTENLISNLNVKRSMNGQTYTYVKSSNSRVLKYTFRMTRGKALEFQRFCEFYNASEIKLLDWKGELWKVHIITNPIDFVLTGRAAPTQDQTDVNIEFEGVRLNG